MTFLQLIAIVLITTLLCLDTIEARPLPPKEPSKSTQSFEDDVSKSWPESHRGQALERSEYNTIGYYNPECSIDDEDKPYFPYPSKPGKRERLHKKTNNDSQKVAEASANEVLRDDLRHAAQSSSSSRRQSPQISIEENLDQINARLSIKLCPSFEEPCSQITQEYSYTPWQ